MNADDDDDVAVINEDEPAAEANNITVQLVNGDVGVINEDESAADTHNQTVQLMNADDDDDVAVIKKMNLLQKLTTKQYNLRMRMLMVMSLR